MLYIVVCGLPRSAILFHIYHINCMILEEKRFMGHKLCFFLFSLQLLSEKFLILRRIRRDMMKNVYRSSCEVPVTLVRF